MMWTNEGLYFYSEHVQVFWKKVGAESLVLFNLIVELDLYFEKLCSVKLPFALPVGFSDHRVHIKKHGSVVECSVHVCWYTVLRRVSVRGVRIVGCVFSSSLFVFVVCCKT